MSEPTPRTIPEALGQAATQFADREAVVDDTTPDPVRLTFRELHQQSRAVAGVLMAHGIQAGDRVAINAPNTHHWIVAALGVLHAGAVLVPINTRFTAVETLDLLHRSGARALVVAGTFLESDRLTDLRAAAGSPETAPTGARPIPGLESVRLVIRAPVECIDPPDATVLDWADLPSAAHAPAAEVEARAASLSGEDVSDVLYTSGTTGRSKGARSAHRQSLGVAAAWAEHAALAANDRYLVVNPFFHSFGYKAGILTCLLRGATLVPLPVFDVHRVATLVEQERITVLPGPPTIYQGMLDASDRDKYDLSSLRLAVTGATTVPVALIEQMRRELTFDTVLTAYGLTEAVVATMCCAGDDPATVSASCGRATAGFELRVADMNGHPVSAGVVGEVLVRGPNTMLGYLDEPDATARAIDSSGWLHTGDLGRVDEHGYLTITDRLKDMYICGGFNVYPAEVEQALTRLDGVAEAAVIGVPHTRLGQVGAAYIVPRPGHELSTADVTAFCRERLANYKVPRHVEIREDLPRNSSGKILKRKLQES